MYNIFDLRYKIQQKSIKINKLQFHFNRDLLERAMKLNIMYWSVLCNLYAISSVIYKVRLYDEKVYETDSWNVDSFFAYKFGLFIDMNIIYNRRHIAIRA